MRNQRKKSGLIVRIEADAARAEALGGAQGRPFMAAAIYRTHEYPLEHDMRHYIFTCLAEKSRSLGLPDLAESALMFAGLVDTGVPSGIAECS
jgi:hypothetical protein